jgi:drug/metabolite transporter (DMT)-like permease
LNGPAEPPLLTSVAATSQPRALRAISGLGLLAVSIWGASFVATRIALEWLTPFGLVATRLWIGFAFLALLSRSRGGAVLPARRDMASCGVLSVLLAGHLLIQATGLLYTSAINTGWIIGFFPVAIAIGAQVFGKQRLRPLGWGGVSLGTAGVLVVMLRTPPNFAQARWGDLLQLGSCLTWTAYTLVGAGPVARSGALRVTALSMGMAAALVTVVTLGWQAGHLGDSFQHAAVTGRSLAALVFLGLLCNGLAYYLWFRAQHEHGPARVGGLLYVEPLVALLTGALLLHEPVTANAVAGGAVVLLGVWLVARGSAKAGAG